MVNYCPAPSAAHKMQYHISFETKYVRNEVSTEHSVSNDVHIFVSLHIRIMYEGHSHFVRYEVRILHSLR